MSSIGSRVKRLEERRGNEFRVVAVTEFDFEGHQISAACNEADVWAVHYSDGKRTLSLKRQRDEEPQDFQARLVACAKEKFETTGGLTVYADGMILNDGGGKTYEHFEKPSG